MREIKDGIEVQNNHGEKVGTIFFDNDNLYFASGTLPIIIKSVNANTVKQLGEFFKYHAISPISSGFRIDFHSVNGDFSLRIIDKIIYIYQEKLALQWESVGLSELKKVGIWLTKNK